MTGPVWDGEGTDPWLPHRVNALLDAGSAERSMYAVAWEALSSWMVVTSRRVMAGPVPQPDMIFAQAPAWETKVGQIIFEAVLPIMDRAYNSLMGADYSWRDRPNVLQYLAGVRNRLVRTPDEVFTLVTGQLAAGVTMGEGIYELSNRVENVLSITETPRWENRAVTIARTETIGALNSSRTDAFQAYADDTGEDLERMWLATADNRTRKTHGADGADGQRVGLTEPFIVGGAALMNPGDPAGPAAETVNCRCTTLLLERGENIDLSSRQRSRR